MSEAIAPKVRSVENMVKRAREKTRQHKGTPACPTCHVTLWLSFFFDGTGNNDQRDFPRKHSNVAALFRSHINLRATGIVPFYYEGLGTPFEFGDRYETKTIATRAGPRTIEKIGYKEEGESTAGLAFASGITERLEKALFDFSYAVDDWRSRRRVDEINVAAFGFSRGATEARAFMHWLAKHSKVTLQGAKLSYDGIPVNVKFLGIFDTVESVGMAADNKMPELIKTTIPPFVQNCCHIVAAHELRHAFPVTVLDSNRHRQVVYPGAHADIGGGYDVKEQGRANVLARVALLQMLDEARGAGLKMLSVGEMKAADTWEKRHQPSFDVPKDVIETLSGYIAETKPSGSMQQHFEAHMKQYWAWIDAGLAAEDVKQKRAGRDAGTPTKDLQIMSHLLRNQARTAEGRGQEGKGPAHKAVKPAVEKLFEHYIHDSFEHFSMTGGTLMTDLSIADYYKVRKILPPTA